MFSYIQYMLLFVAFYKLVLMLVKIKCVLLGYM